MSAFTNIMLFLITVIASIVGVFVIYTIMRDVADIFRCPDALSICGAVLLLFLSAMFVLCVALLWIFVAAGMASPQHIPATLSGAIQVLEAMGNQ